MKRHEEYTANHARFNPVAARAFLSPQLIGALPFSRPWRATLAPLNTAHGGPVARREIRSLGMKTKTKPAVFTADKVTADMLMLAVQAMVVGAAAALLSALVVAAVVALMA
jgi:hypothetical protein